MQTTTLNIDGMTCGGCVASVQRALTRIEGVSDASVTLQPPQATVAFDPAKVEPANLIAAIEDAGFDVKR